ncbi:MAG: LysM peptidoglycan-binding domain-containing protein [Treponema sp.]|nr:LysM peptidoglycan-binding domain-containing protein [Treponema sp.]
MKKIVLFALLITVVLLASCASTDDSSFGKIYDRHTGLILAGSTTYTVRSGDTLAGISRQVYPNGYYYPVIMLASKNVILDPDKIQPGMQLTVPNLQVNLNNPDGKKAVKGVILDLSRVENGRGRKETAKGMRDLANSL